MLAEWGPYLNKFLCVFHVRTSDQLHQQKWQEILKFLKRATGSRAYRDGLLGHAYNRAKPKIAQMEFDVRRCLLACEFRTRSSLNNNCVIILYALAIISLCRFACSLCSAYTTMLLFDAAATEMWRLRFGEIKSVFLRAKNKLPEKIKYDFISPGIRRGGLFNFGPRCKID